MKNTLKMAILGGMAMVVMGIATPAAANHSHYLATPGTCVEDIAHGQTSKTEGEGGYHMFHTNVHLGQPGTVFNGNADHPIAVGRGSCPGS